jgi:methionyl-tRNA synthetase
MEKGSLSQALREVCAVAVFGNEYFQRKAPWADADDQAVASAFHLVKAIAILLRPFVPTYSAQVLEIMGLVDADWQDIDSTAGGKTIGSSRVLIEKIDISEIEAKVESLHEKRVPLEEFSRLDIQVGKVVSVEDIPGSKRLYRLQVDVGKRKLTSVAGIKGIYSAEALIGRELVFVVNLEAAVIHGVKSEAMLLAAGKGVQMSLLCPEHEVAPGTSIG